MQQLEPKGKQHWEKDLERFWAVLHIMLSNGSLLSNRNKMQTMGGILNYLVKALKIKISSVQLLSHVRLFLTPWTAARQAPLSITNSRSLRKLMSIESVISSNHLILCQPLLLLPQSFPTSESFPTTRLFASSGQRIGVSASVSVLPMNIQGWFP